MVRVREHGPVSAEPLECQLKLLRRRPPLCRVLPRPHRHLRRAVTLMVGSILLAPRILGYGGDQVKVARNLLVVLERLDYEFRQVHF